MAGSDEDMEAMNSQDTGALGAANSRMEDDEPALPLDPNSRLLERAQAALRAQLLTQKQELEEALREKGKELKDVKTQREDLGVELYGVQQQLAKLQMTLEKAHEEYAEINRVRLQAEKDLAAMRATNVARREETGAGRVKAEQFQVELDRLGATLRQVEEYNERVKGEIAVTRRATYAAEEAISKMEKEKREQDLLIDQLQETLKSQGQQVALYAAQLAAQRRETQAAQDTLSEAASEMEAIHFEKKQLTLQWKSSLIGMARRDEALQAMEDALRQQREQERAVEGELEVFRKGLREEQERGERMAATIAKIERQGEQLKKQIAAATERRDAAAEKLGQLAAAREETEASFAQARADGKRLRADVDNVEKAMFKANQEIQELESRMLSSLSEQTTVEKGAQQTAVATQRLRLRVREESLAVVQLQNELAKIRVDVLTTHGHNAKLREALAAVDVEIREKSATIEKYQAEIKRRNDEVEKKTKDVDRLNKAYDKLMASVVDENMGPLEATIANITKEVVAKTAEAKDLQRAWVTCQTELVALTNENNGLAEKVQRLRAEHTVLKQRRSRLDGQCDEHKKEIKELGGSVRTMHSHLQKLNEMIAKNAELRGFLANETFTLETSIVASLKEIEEEMVHLGGKIEAARAEKRELLSDVVDMERQIMLWERKIALEKETQAAIDPTLGNEVVVVMRKEIHRMKLRLADVLAQQERLIGDMERAILKRDNIATKGRAQGAKKGAGGLLLMETGLVKACADLRRSVKETEKETAEVGMRIQEAAERRDALAREIEEGGSTIDSMRESEEGLGLEVDNVVASRMRELMNTTRLQKTVKRFEDVQAGKWKGLGLSEEDLAAELSKALERRKSISEVVQRICKELPHLEASLTKCLAQVSVEG